jgi:hypothetical protein
MSVQLLTYADDIDITAKSPTALKEAFYHLKELLEYEKKTKYMTSRINKHQPKKFQIEKCSFEIVQSFVYLGSLLDVNNDNSDEIRKRILLVNKCFYALKRQFRSQFLSIKNKVKLNKTLIRPVLAYGAETWVLSKSDENVLKVCERKILRAIFGPTNEHGK